MREILFRGKRVDNGKWVYGYYIPVCFGRFPCEASIVPEPIGAWEPIKVIPENIGEYTGLNDTNGNKIFEGDIVTYVEEGLRGDFSQGVMEIVWNEKTAGFCGRTTQGRLVEITHLKNVIGNIHDNPELMEAKQ